MKKLLFSISMVWLAAQLSFAQTYTVSTVAGLAGTRAYTDGSIAVARFGNIRDLLVDASGNLIISDTFNHRIRKIENGTVSTLAGDGGAFTGANDPYLTAFDKDGNIIVVQRTSNKISKVTPAGVVRTIAGSGVAGFIDDASDPLQAKFNNCIGVAIDSKNNIFITDYGNKKIRKITYDNGSSSWTGVSTVADETAVSTGFTPIGITVDKDDNLYFYDRYTIKQMTKTGVISTIVGVGTAGASNGTAGQPLTASIGQVYGMCFDNEENLILSDLSHNQLRKITPGTGGDWTTAEVSTIAGIGTAGYADGSGATAAFNSPTGITADSNGIIYVADANNYVIRKLTPSTLPVRFGTFNAQILNNAVKLKWQTLSEADNSHYEVLRSANNSDFVSLGTVISKSNSSSIQNYSFTDNRPLNGTNYYQLKQVDKDGKFSLSAVVAINFYVEGKSVLNVNYVQGQLQINSNIKSADEAKLSIYNLIGQKLKTTKIKTNNNDIITTVIPIYLQKGVYVLKLNSSVGNFSTKFVVE